MAFCCGFACCAWMPLGVALRFVSFVWIMCDCGCCFWLFGGGVCFFVVGYSLCYFIACLLVNWWFDDFCADGGFA